MFHWFATMCQQCGAVASPSTQHVPDLIRVARSWQSNYLFGNYCHDRHAAVTRPMPVYEESAAERWCAPITGGRPAPNRRGGKKHLSRHARKTYHDHRTPTSHRTLLCLLLEYEGRSYVYIYTCLPESQSRGDLVIVIKITLIATHNHLLSHHLLLRLERRPCS